MNSSLARVNPWYQVHAAAGTLSLQITSADDVGAAVKVQGLTAVTPGRRSLGAAVCRVLGPAPG